MTLWYLNEYIVNDKLKFKIVKSPQVYENWYLVDTYVLYDKKFICWTTYRTIYLNTKKSMVKKLLEFFNKL